MREKNGVAEVNPTTSGVRHANVEGEERKKNRRRRGKKNENKENIRKE